MAIDHDVQDLESFDVVEALYQEAELMQPKEELTADVSHAVPETAPKKAPLIQSRKPRAKAKTPPIFTRISDLYEEAEAIRFLTEEEAQKTSQPEAIAPNLQNNSAPQAEASYDDFSPPAFDAPVMAQADEPSGNTEDKIAQSASEAQLAEALLDDDEFAIPADFGAAPNADVIADVATTKDVTEEATEEELSLLADALAQDDELVAKDLTISDEIEPAVALSDVMEQLTPPADIPAMPMTNKGSDEGSQNEAVALAALDEARAPASDEMLKELEDVRQAVEEAQALQATTHHASDATSAPVEEVMSADDTSNDVSQAEMAPEDVADDEPSQAQSDDTAPHMSAVTAGPELVAFIGEAVREVLDEELPHMVRGLVDEALGERQGRYGRSDTPHIGLRTKPSRH